MAVNRQNLGDQETSRDIARKNYDITRFDRKASGSTDNFEIIECPFKLVC